MSRRAENCDICGNEDLRSVLDLGSSPPACGGEGSFPLELVYCDRCGLAQLSESFDPEASFPPNYPYSSGNSKALRENFADLVAGVPPLGKDDLVVDIGANDGTLLSHFAGCKTVGVEPTEQAKTIRSPVYQEFFTEELAKRIRVEHGPAKVITACNVLAHVDDIHDVMRGINHLLADDGVLIAENHDLASVVDGQWDSIYHEHLRFYDRHSFGWLLEAYRLEHSDSKSIPTHGGSFRVFATRAVGWGPPPRYDFDKLAKGASASREEIRKATKGGVWGIGATARATTLINYCGLDVEDVKCVCEVAGSDKIGRYIPGTRIPVVDEAELFEKQPDTAMLFSWHLADQIVPKLRDRGYDGEIIVPLPKVRSV